jgi:hypothetical protein
MNDRQPHGFLWIARYSAQDRGKERICEIAKNQP